MGFKGLFIGITAGLIFLSTAHADPLPSNEWSRVLKPTSGKPNSIGFYSGGCIAGAQTLSLDGAGYQVMRIFRNRYYGQPELLSFIQNLGQQLSATNSGVLMGDLGQPRGGTMPYGHASHQVGLDVDIWYWTHPEQNQRSLTADERNNLPMPTVLKSNGKVDETKFTAETILKLKISATSPKVERIFVNPAIKAYLCTKLPAAERYWLHALRPWPGHDDHYHVRLSCPADNKDCVHQAPQAAGNGCDELRALERNEISYDLDGDLEETSMSSEIEQLLQNDVTKADLPAACAKVLKEKV